MTNRMKINTVLKHHLIELHKLNFSKLIFLLVLITCLTVPESFSQLKVYPLSRTKDKTVEKSKSRNSLARTQELTPRSLPFWDDFSTTPVDKAGDTLSNYPVDSLWVNKKNVWINKGLGLNPPSVNVATFDGLGPDHLPYSDQLLSNGLRDTLLSQPIKLGEVVPADRNSVYLSFFYQWQGNGEAPDANDVFRVEFKNELEVWETVMTIRPLLTFINNAFYDTLVKVEGDKFFHDNFQFRFLNYGRLSGPYDTWNIDYVYLNKNRNAADRYLPDRTITSAITNLFSNYRSIPYHHFLINKPISQPKFDVFNVKNDTSTLSYLTEGTFINYKENITSTFTDTLGGGSTTPIDGATGIIYQRERKTVTMQHIPDGNDPVQFDPDADSVAVSLKVRLFTGDTFNPETGAFANDYDPLKYQPLDFRSNDTLRSNYILSDYYAYDDGFAEYTVGLTQAGNRAAYLFEMLSDDPDTLIGFDIYFPDYGVPSNLNVDFTVYNDQEGLPGIILYSLPSFTIKRNGLNKFEKIRFGEPFLVEDKFYVAWKAPVGGTLKIGLDTNNDSGEKLFVNTNGFWYQNTDIKGSVMIRPVFGGGGIISGIEEEIQARIFPNPNQGEFFVPNEFDILQVSNITGQSIPFERNEQDENSKVVLGDISPGLYILIIRKGNKLFSSKIIVK